jgi:O-antigen/teichoic acid export membrane protein
MIATAKGDMKMEGPAIWGIVRTILAAFSGYIVAKGWVDDATYQAVLGALGTIFVAVWSVIAKKPAAK